MYDVTKIWEALAAVLLASLGGFARVLNARGDKKPKLNYILSEIFVSGFAGLIVMMAAHGAGITGAWVGVSSGLAGWMGPMVLNAVSRKTWKMLGIEVSEDSKDDKPSKDDKD